MNKKFWLIIIVALSGVLAGYFIPRLTRLAYIAYNLRARSAADANLDYSVCGVVPWNLVNECVDQIISGWAVKNADADLCSQIQSSVIKTDCQERSHRSQQLRQLAGQEGISSFCTTSDHDVFCQDLLLTLNAYETGDGQTCQAVQSAVQRKACEDLVGEAASRQILGSHFGLPCDESDAFCRRAFRVVQQAVKEQNATICAQAGGYESLCRYETALYSIVSAQNVAACENIDSQLNNPGISYVGACYYDFALNAAISGQNPALCSQYLTGDNFIDSCKDKAQNATENRFTYLLTDFN